jgi:hypothetical protein
MKTSANMLNAKMVSISKPKAHAANTNVRYGEAKTPPSLRLFLFFIVILYDFHPSSHTLQYACIKLLCVLSRETDFFREIIRQ